MRGHSLLLAAVAVALVACSDRPGSAGQSVAANFTGFSQDPIALRVARTGGLVRAYHYPRLDSVIWTSTASVGAGVRSLAFDPENGLEAYVDRDGSAGWIDLRVGTIKSAEARGLDGLTSRDAWSIYGIARDSIVHRSTPGGEWEFAVSGRVSRLFPLQDGGLVVISRNEADARITRLRPPDSRKLDSATVPIPDLAVMSPLGDRMYLAMDRDLVAYNTRTFEETVRVTFEDSILSLATTPSGDRVFATVEGHPELAVLDRYSGELATHIRLPGSASAVRVDALGRLLLVRPDSGDSTWVISLATNELVATLPTVWREDLPTVAPDGSVATISGRDVRFTMPGQEKPRIVVRAGGAETWQFVYWNGFRPRAPGLDQPVVFPVDSTEFGSPLVDKLTVVGGVTDPVTTLAPPASDSIKVGPVSPTVASFSVQVAALLSQSRAGEVAREVRSQGLTARVLTSSSEGVRIYRVILGPYRTRQEAERAGRRSGRSYWIIEGER